MLKVAAALGALVWVLACTPSEEQPRPPKAEPKTEDVQAFLDEAPRAAARILYLVESTPPSSAGQLVIDHGQPQWKPEYEEQLDELTRGKRYRLGSNYWTTLDTNLTLNLAGTEVAPGLYYIVLERSQGDDWYLVLLDPETIRARRLDAFFVEESPEGTRVPLDWKRTDTPVEKLTVRLVPDPEDLKKATLEIAWGRHRLTALVTLGL